MTGPMPTALAALFIHKATISISELAAGLPMDEKTLRGHIAAERLACRFKGAGRKKPRRVFSEQDVSRFLQTISEPPALETEAAPCHSQRRDRPTGISTLKSVVLDFPGRPGVAMNVTQRKSRRKSAARPPRSSKPGSASSGSR